MKVATAVYQVAGLLIVCRLENSNQYPARERAPVEHPFPDTGVLSVPADPIENIGVELSQGVLIEGDIRQWYGLPVETTKTSSFRPASFLSDPAQEKMLRNSVEPEQTWLEGIVAYVIDPTYSFTERQIILDSIKELGAIMSDRGTACLRFVERQKEEDFLYISGQLVGCWADVGRQGGNQTVSISRASACVTKGTVMHEIMHALGFWHEHNRPDRDQYIEIITPNIRIDHLSDFKINNNGKVSVEYDFYSIMHYKTNQFSKVSHLKTIRILKANINESLVGQRDELSSKDKERIMLLYGCSKAMRSAVKASEPAAIHSTKESPMTDFTKQKSTVPDGLEVGQTEHPGKEASPNVPSEEEKNWNWK